jgi:transcriptional regulator with XRE-family HTH domain
VTSSELLAAIGRSIRSARLAAGLTQARLGARSGIDGKYVSEIERGTRNLPISTLHAIVKKGLGLELDIQFQTDGSRPSQAPLPKGIDNVARTIMALPAKQQRMVLAVIETLLLLTKRS